MGKKNKKSKKNQETYEEKPKTKIEYMPGNTSDVIPSKDDEFSSTKSIESSSGDIEAENIVEELDKTDNKSTDVTTEEDFIEVRRDRPTNSKSKHGKFRSANDLLGTPQVKKGTDWTIPNSSRGNDTYALRNQGRTEYKNVSKHNPYGKFRSANDLLGTPQVKEGTDLKIPNSSRGNDTYFLRNQGGTECKNLSKHEAYDSKSSEMSRSEKPATTSYEGRRSGNSNSRSSSNDRSFNKSGPSVNKRFDEWLALMDSDGKFFKEQKNVIEVFGDLFMAPDEYSLGHCVAEDMNMGSGIATTFRSMFKNVAELLNQGQTQGGLAVLERNGRFIYYLVTKPYSNGKPTYETLFRSLVKMRHHIVSNNVKKVALPQIGCGLDNLDWNRVKPMLQFIFGDVDVEIKIYNFQKDPYAPTPTNKHRKCRVVNVLKPIKEIEDYTIIIYPCSLESFESDVMRDLDEKFRVLKDYRMSNRCLGTAIRTKHYTGNFILYGVVIKDKKTDKIDYRYFQTCLNQINKDNKKDLFEYVAIQAFEQPSDDKVMTKLVNLMRNTLIGVDVYVCWPKNLERYAPPEAQYY